MPNLRFPLLATTAAICGLSGLSWQCATAQNADAPGAAADTSAAKSTIGASAYGSHLQAILTAIQATPDQRKKITEILEEFRPKIVPLKTEYKRKQAEFLQTMIAGRAPEDLMLKQEAMNEVQSRIINEYCAMNLKVRRLLNPHQCEQYENYRHQQGWTHH